MSGINYVMMEDSLLVPRWAVYQGVVDPPDPVFVYGTDKAATLARAGTSGTLTTTHVGNLVITTPGTTITDTLVTGWVEVRAANVTLRNVKIEVGAALMGSYNPPTQAGIFCLFGYGGLVFENVEIAPTNPTVNTYGIIGAGFTAKDVWIHDVVDGIQVNTANGGPITVLGGLIEKLRWYSVDPRQTNGAHSDAIQIILGTGHVIRGVVIRLGNGPAARTVEGAYSGGFSVIISPGGGGPVDDVTVDKVWFEGDGYSHFKLGQGSWGLVTPLTLTDNRFEQYTDNPVIHGSEASINAATITGNTGPGGIVLPGSQIWADPAQA